MAEIQQTRYDKILRRVCGLIGPGAKVQDALSELFPVIDVEDPPANLLALGGTRMAVGRSLQSSTAGQVNMSMLRNPGGSNMIITLTDVRFYSTTAQLIVCGPTLNTYTTQELTAFTDGRLFGAQLPIGEVRHGLSPAAGVDFWNDRAENTTFKVYAPPNAVAVLTPGTAWSVSNTVVNTLLAVSYTWTERVAEESELNL